MGSNGLYDTRILIAEDDPSHRNVLMHFLTQEGYELVQAQDGPSALRALRDGVDLAILDLHLPLMDGLNVVRNIRRDGMRTPILVLTGRTDEVDRIISFEAGADDYVAKPFLPREVVCRVKAILNRVSDRTGLPGGRIFTYGRLELDEAAHEVRVDGEVLRLRKKEYALMLTLACNPNLALSRRSLMEKAWGDDAYGDERTVDTHIRRLRMHMENRKEPLECIATVYGYGYKLTVG